MPMIKVEAFKIKNAMKKAIDSEGSEGGVDPFDMEFFRHWLQKAVDAEAISEDGCLWLYYNEVDELKDWL